MLPQFDNVMRQVNNKNNTYMQSYKNNTYMSASQISTAPWVAIKQFKKQ